MPHLFDPLTLRGLTLTHRVLVSPMCQYSSTDGFANDWHLVHLGSRAVGGAALVFTEATAVTAEGRISPEDLGIWRDDHVEPLQRIVQFIHGQQSAAGMQIAHAGRKGSTAAPWNGGLGVAAASGGWQPVGPTAEPFTSGYPVPRALATDDIAGHRRGVQTRGRSRAGRRLRRRRSARGPRLSHSSVSLAARQHTDGSVRRVVRESRAPLPRDRGRRARVWPERLPVFVRISATDWAPGGWDLDQSVELSRLLRERGVDLVDCSSGGAVPYAQIAVGPGYQVPFAERIRREANVATGAVGLITTAAQAEEIVVNGRADCVLMARELLRHPYWPEHAAPNWAASFRGRASICAPRRATRRRGGLKSWLR